MFRSIHQFNNLNKQTKEVYIQLIKQYLNQNL